MKTDSDELDREIDTARRRIAAAQSAMAEKLEGVEKQIRDTVAGAESAVDDVVSSVKGTISETVHSVKQTFDLPYQTREHPWLVLGGSVLVGFLIGGRRGATRIGKSERVNDSDDPYRQQLQRGVAGGVLNQFKGEIGSLRSAAVGAIVTALWEMAKQSLSASNGPSRPRENQQRGQTDKPGW
jgi:hypothetical protein